MKRQSLAIKILAQNYRLKREIGKRTLANILAVIKTSIGPRDQVFELGSGDGRILFPLSRLLPESSFIGIDVSRKMLLQAFKYIKESGVQNVKLINVDFDSPQLINLLKKQPPDCFLLFQSIHFSKNPYKLLGRLSKFLKRDGKIIIATTTHQQFYELPYCEAFPYARELELIRTPNLSGLKSFLLKRGFKVKNTHVFEIKKVFRSSQEIERWLKQKPFSVLAMLDKKDFQEGVRNFLNKYSKEVVIDKFSICTLIKID